jgi:branched-chain amino acid transport system ATP-binding protein
MLSVTGLSAGYGAAQVLFGLSFSIAPGETLALMGRNGMGKTTTIRAVMGLLRPTAGTVRFDTTELTGTRPYRAARAGIGLVPEGRQVFPTLTVEENLVATATDRGAWTLDRVYGLVPRLLERRRHRGLHLSGGEQQMLAIGRALMTNPRLLILDEATEGLAPLVRAEIYGCLRALKQQGLSILLIDKHLAAVTRLADRVVVLEKGRIAWEGCTAALVADPALVDRHLHV